MIKKHIITIAGRPGSGKSTTARLLAEKFEYNHFSTGDLFRQTAKEEGIDVLQANLTAEQNHKLDHLVDGKLMDIEKEDDFLVIDSRLAWHFVPSSFKVFLNLDLTVAAKRIISEMGENRLKHENIPKDPGEYAKVLKQRLDSEGRRYMELYNVSPYVMSNYDLVIDTDANNIEQVVEMVLKNYESWMLK